MWEVSHFFQYEINYVKRFFCAHSGCNDKFRNTLKVVVNFLLFNICLVGWRLPWHKSLDRLKLWTSLFFDYHEFPIIWRYINCATRVVSLCLQPREFIRLTMRWKRGAGSLCELFIALWLNSNHFSRVTDREMLSALIEGIDFPTPLRGTLERHNQRLWLSKKPLHLP